MPFVERLLTLRNGPPWGFRLQEADAEGLLISRIRKRSPAEEAGLHEGDKVLAINGTSSQGMSHSKAVQVIDYASGALNIKVGRQESRQIKSLQFEHTSEAVDEVESSMQVDIQEKENTAPPPQPTPAPWMTPQPAPQAEPIEVDYDAGYEDDDEEDTTPPPGPTIRKIPIYKLTQEPTSNPDSSYKKKQFSDSAFYSDADHNYPTVEEQIEMAHKVAASLSDPVNSESKGANMFEKRRLRMEKCITEGPNPGDDDEELDVQAANGAYYYPPEFSGVPPPPAVYPGIPPPPPPPPPGVPKTLQEYMEKVQTFPKSEHKNIAPEQCFNIASALHGSGGRGSQIFAKRKARSKKWEVEGPEPEAPALQPMMAMMAGPSHGPGMGAPAPGQFTSQSAGPKSKLPSKLAPQMAQAPGATISGGSQGHGVQSTNQPGQSAVASSQPKSSEWRPVQFKIPQKS